MYPNLNLIPLGYGDKGKRPSCGDAWEKEENFVKNTKLVKIRKSPMYGILTGVANGLICIDYDIYNEKYNPEHNINYTTLKTKHPQAVIAQTQSGGFHVYHKYSDIIDAWTNVTGLDGYIDIKQDHWWVCRRSKIHRLYTTFGVF